MPPLAPLRPRGKKGNSAKANAPAIPDPTLQKERKRRRLERPRSKKGPFLERLPPELIVEIFIESTNYNLALCNRYLRSLLANEYCVTRLTRKAFAPTWDRYFDCPKREDVSDPTSLVDPDDDRWDVYHAQNLLMEQPFFTIHLILKAQQAWFDETRPPSKAETIHWRTCRVPNVDCNEHCRAGSAHEFNAAACFEHDYQAAKRGVRARAIGWSQYRSRQDVEPGISMKKKFLKGPWAEDDQRLAFWLYTGGAHVSHELDLDDTNPLEIALSHTVWSTLNEFFVYGSSELISVTAWPLYDAYDFYLQCKGMAEDEPGFWAMAELCDRLRNTFDGDDPRALRIMRRDAGRDPNNSDLEYDPENDSDVDADFEGDANLERIRKEVRHERMLAACEREDVDGEDEDEEEEDEDGLEGYIDAENRDGADR